MKTSKTMPQQKRIALIAHDARKDDLLAWVQRNREALRSHSLLATGTTGAVIAEATGLEVRRYKSGPLGGDQQIGALIAEGGVEVMIFFWDPLEPQPHDPDVKALLRLAVLYNIPTASNLATADFLMSSPFMASTYELAVDDFADFNRRRKVLIETEGSGAEILPDELSSLIETLHLLRSPKNAERLLTALNRALEREGQPRSIEDLSKETGLDYETA
jgi:methylglyoxal synthase